MQTAHKNLVIINLRWSTTFPEPTSNRLPCWGGGASCFDKAGRTSTYSSLHTTNNTRLLSITWTFVFRTLWQTTLLSKTQKPKPRDWLLLVFITTASRTAPNERKYFAKLSCRQSYSASLTVCGAIRKSPHKNFAAVNCVQFPYQLDMESQTQYRIPKKITLCRNGDEQKNLMNTIESRFKQKSIIQLNDSEDKPRYSPLIDELFHLK